jgi:hypothetical protein
MNEYQNTLGGQGISGAYAQQFSPQSFFGGLGSGRLAGVFGTPGAQFGQSGGAFGAGTVPYNFDPITAAYAQQQQLQQLQYLQQMQQLQQLQQQQQPQQSQGLSQRWAAQWPGQAGQQFGGMPGQFGRISPFNIDPIAAAQAQQHAMQQLQQQLQNLQQSQASLQGWLGNSAGQIGQPPIAAYAQQQGQAVLQAQQQLLQAQQSLQAVQQCLQQVQQIQQAQLQQAQLQQGQFPQYGWSGNGLGQPGQQLGGAGSQFGQMSPLNIDPISAAYAQQAGGYQGYQAGQAPGSFGGGFGGQQTVH